MASSQDEIDAILDQSGDSGSRMLALTRLLRSVWPSCPLYACWLFDETTPEFHVIDGAGASCPHWVELLQPVLAVPATETHNLIHPLQRTLKLPGYVLVMASIIYHKQDFGKLAIAVREDDPSLSPADARELLATLSGQLTPRVSSAVWKKEVEALRRELFEQTRLAHVGELAGAVIHESNNFLNVVMLQVAVTESSVSEELRAQLHVLRRQGAEFKALIQQFQLHRQQLKVVLQPVDLNRVVRDAVQRLDNSSSVSTLCLTPDLPPVMASAMDLRRLLTFLLDCRAKDLGQDITIRTEKVSDKVLLSLQGSIPGIASEISPEADESLVWSACQGLVRRLGGKLFVKPNVDNELAIIVELRVSQST